MNPLCHDTHQARFALPLVSFQCISHMCQLNAHSVVVHGSYVSDRCLPDAGTSCTEVLRITTVQLRSLLLWACDHSRWCPALYELCKLESFFFLLTEIWTNVLWHRNPAQYQLCQSDRGDDGRNNSGIHIQLHKCVLQLKKKSLRAWDLSHRSPAHYQLCQPDCSDDGRNNSGIHVQLHKCVLQ